MNLYAWKRVFDDLTTIVYTISETPSQGDQLYKLDGTPYADHEAITVSDADIALASTVSEYNTLHGEPYDDPDGDYIYVNGYTIYSFDPFEIGGQDYYIPLYRDAFRDTQVETEKPLTKLTIKGKTYYIKDAQARQSVTSKQDTLVSGTNIKTINNQSILGSGNITIQGGGGSSIQQYDYEEQAYADGGIIASFVNINLNTYLSQITNDHAITKFAYDGSDWYIGDSNPSVVDLTDYGISISGYTPVANDEFYIYSFCLRNRTDFTFVYSGDTVHCAFLNGNLILKSDYYLTDETENRQTYKKINFNNYTLKASDKLSTL